MNLELDLVSQASRGDHEVLAALFNKHQTRLKRMVAVRMDPRLNARLSSSDVLQDVFLDVQRRIGEFDADQYPFFVWLRLLTGQRLVDLHRHHLGAKKRNAGLEVHKQRAPDASTDSLASFFVSTLTTPSRAMARDEIRSLVHSALSEMDSLDRELLSLRHFEQLSNKEAAHHLGLNPSTASSRYLQAIRKLRAALSRIPGYSDDQLT